MPFAYHLHYLDAYQQRLCAPKRLESQHRPNAPLDIAMILFDQIVQILLLSDGDGFIAGLVRVERCQGGGIGTTLVDGDPLRFTMMSDCFAKEA